MGLLLNSEGVTVEDAAKWRTNFSGLASNEVIGMDIFPGVTVDVVMGLCASDLFEQHPQYEGYFGLVFASALLEHVKEPHLVARNLSRMLRPGRHIYFAGPWVSGYHPYPDDYWRITVLGFEILFPELTVRQWWYTGTHGHVGIEVTDRKYERKLFAQPTVAGAASLITDRCYLYLD